MDINAIYQAQLGRAPGQVDLDYWNKLLQGENAPSQEQIGHNLGLINSAYNQLLGRNMQEGTASALNPILNDMGVQGVRGHLAGSDEYLNRMLNSPGVTNVPAWQQAARQGTMHQAQMPGSFWDYSNPDLSTPDWARKIMSPEDAISTQIMDRFTNPESSDWLKELLGIDKDDEKDKGGKKGGTAGGSGKGSPRGNRFAPNPEGTTFFERVRGY